MQVAQSIPSNSYVKGSSNDIIFKLYKILSIVKGNLEEYIRPYIYVWMKGVRSTNRNACMRVEYYSTKQECFTCIG
jgi:hypothetical protein